MHERKPRRTKEDKHPFLYETEVLGCDQSDHESSQKGNETLGEPTPESGLPAGSPEMQP